MIFRLFIYHVPCESSNIGTAIDASLCAMGKMVDKSVTNLVLA